MAYQGAAVFAQVAAYNFSNLPVDPAAVWVLRIGIFMFGIPFWAAIIFVYSRPLPDEDNARWQITAPIGFVYNLGMTLGLAIRWWTLYPGPALSMDRKETTTARDVIVVVLLSSIVPMSVACVPLLSLWITNILFPLAFLEAVYQPQNTFKPRWTEYLG